MKLNIYAEVDNVDSRHCASSCPMLNEGRCSLFNSELEEIDLAEGVTWAGDERDYQRDWRCYGLEND